MNKQKIPTICFVAGKSGGHIIPAITLAKQYIAEHADKHTDNHSGKINILFFSTHSPLDKKIAEQAIEEKIITTHVIFPLNNIPYKKITKMLFFAGNLTISFCKSIWHLVSMRPQKIISMGGYISIPVCIAGYLLRIPIELYELNAIPGKAVTFLAPLATTIHACFKAAHLHLPAHKCQLSPYPIRFAKNNIKTALTLSTPQKKVLYQMYGLCPSKQTILILGGSQGSYAINICIADIFEQIIKQNPDIAKTIQIIHQTGGKSAPYYREWTTFYRQQGIDSIVFDFKNNIQDYYQLADLVICRSGAGTLFETLFFQKKCITIPLETTTTAHQVDNAKELEKLYPNLIKMVKQNEKIDRLQKIITQHLQTHYID